MSMYSLKGHGGMLRDRARVEAHRLALQQSVRDGSVVVDVGAGTGIFSIMACLAGAARVYAIEADPVLELGRELARSYGFADRITFIEERSDAVTLPEKADVIVGDLRGILPYFKGNIASMRDAAERFLAPGGVLIPRRDRVWAAAVDDVESWSAICAPWDAPIGGIDMRFVLPRVTNFLHKVDLGPENVVTDAKLIADVEYGRSGETLAANVSWTLDAPRTIHGVALWFDAELGDGIGYSSAPSHQRGIYGQAFLPFREPLPCERGAELTCSIDANLVQDDYVWTWQYTLAAKENLIEETRQSTFFADPVSLRQLDKVSPQARPVASRGARLDATLIRLMDGRRTLADIARELWRRHPERFGGIDEAMRTALAAAARHAR